MFFDDLNVFSELDIKYFWHLIIPGSFKIVKSVWARTKNLVAEVT